MVIRSCKAKQLCRRRRLTAIRIGVMCSKLAVRRLYVAEGTGQIWLDQLEYASLKLYISGKMLRASANPLIPFTKVPSGSPRHEGNIMCVPFFRYERQWRFA
jgi:hypothetical protein